MAETNYLINEEDWKKLTYLNDNLSGKVFNYIKFVDLVNSCVLIRAKKTLQEIFKINDIAFEVF